MSRLSAKLVSLATAVPPNVLSQSDVAAAANEGSLGTMTASSAWRGSSRVPGFASDMRCGRSIGILTPLGWPERTTPISRALPVLRRRGEPRSGRGRTERREVDTIVTVSSTGIATPSLEARVAGRMGFRPDVERVPVFGLGCAGGVSGFSIASRLACSRPGSVVLLVAVEFAARLPARRLTKTNIVATALFGDGAAACVLEAYEGGAAAVEMSGQHTWPDTLDIMGWRMDPQGFGVIFDRAIPPFAQEHIEPAIAGMLAARGTGSRRRRSLRLPSRRPKVIVALGAGAVARAGLSRP